MTVDIRVMLAGVREHQYRHVAAKDQPAQAHLRLVKRELAKLVPDMQVLVSGSGQSLPVVPWIAVLDPDVTTTAQEGLYVVYLYSRDLARVYLSMNQGATQHLRNAENDGFHGVEAERSALGELERESMTMRAGISDASLEGLLREIDLGAPRHFLPRGYEAGNVGAIGYSLARLPDDVTLRADLTRMLALYSDCVDIKDEIRATDAERLQTTAIAKRNRRKIVPKPPIFRPKSSAVYLAEVKAHMQERSPRHEALVRVFGGWVKQGGLIPATNVHPRDLTVDADGQHWLVEAKIVKANAEHAVREAIGQLFSYRHFCYRESGQNDPALVALFSQPVGEGFARLLDSLGIESIWRDGRDWAGSTTDIATSLLKVAEVGRPAST